MKYSLFTKFPLLFKVSEVCNISNKCLLPSKSANKIFLNKTPCTPPSFQYIYIETSTFYHFFTSFHSASGGLYFNPQIIQQNINIFTQGTLYSSFISKKLCVLHPESCRNIHYQFSQWMRCAIFQIKTSVLVIQQNNIFTKETSDSSFILKKIWRSQLQAFFETSTFHHIFSIFNSA